MGIEKSSDKIQHPLIIKTLKKKKKTAIKDIYLMVKN